MELFEQLFTGLAKVGILVMLPILLLSGAIFALVRIYEKRRGPETANSFADIGAASFSLFGAVIGIFISASKDPILTTILPIIITIVTVFITYLTDKSAEDSMKRAYMIYLVGFFLGVAFGASYGNGLVDRGPGT